MAQKRADHDYKHVSVEPRAGWLHCCHDRLNTNPLESRPNVLDYWQVTPIPRRSHNLAPNRNGPISIQGENSYDSKEITDIPTLIDITRCPLSQHTHIPFHQDTLKQMSANQGSETLEMHSPDSAMIKKKKNLPQPGSRFSDLIAMLGWWRVQALDWINVLCTCM